MPETLEIPALLPALPEIVLVVGAMALLMVGAFRGERVEQEHRRRGDPAADPHRRRHRLAAGGQARHLRRQLRGRQLRPLPQASGVDRIGGGDPDVHRLSRGREAAAVRIFDPDPARDHRHDDADFGGRSDRALSRPRTDEPGALRGRRHRSRFRAFDRGGAQIFRPRRACPRACCFTARRWCTASPAR